MQGNSHVWFSGQGATERPPPYPTYRNHWCLSRSIRIRFPFSKPYRKSERLADHVCRVIAERKIHGERDHTPPAAAG
jgi:hypothetical protein